MAKTVVGLFDQSSEADAVVKDLTSSGFDKGGVQVATGSGAAGGLSGTLTSAGVPSDEATWYVEGVRQGGTLVSVRTADEQANRAIEIFNRHNPVDIEDRAGRFSNASGGREEVGTEKGAAGLKANLADDLRAVQSAGTAATSGAPATSRTAAAASATTAGAAAGEQKLQVVEEELQVGKRQVQRGGIRVYTHVTEKPVEASVNLREEHVKIERRPVDRPATEADFNTFKEGTIEVTETAEEAVVGKKARVIEEIVIAKEATERTQTVRDTVRKTDVQVEQVPGEGRVVSGDFDKLDSDFRTNFTSTYKGGEYTYDQAKPAYKYGYDLASNAKGDWSAAESNARTQWEQRNPGTWDKFKDAARYAYDKARSKVSGNS